jgi:hypothetical protein
LISTARALLGAVILIVATAAVTAIFVSGWNPFPPKDYEDCAARAAKDAKSKDALTVLLSVCDSEFKGRRKVGGGYAYYNSCPGGLGRTFDIKGPNPTPDEQKYMRGECLADIEAEREAAEAERQAAQQRAEAARKAAEQRAEAARQAEQAAAYQAAQQRALAAAAANALQLRKSQTIPAVQVTINSFECWSFLGEKCDRADDKVNMFVEVTNRSKEALSGILVGVAVAAANGACPPSYAETHTLEIPLSSGETRTSKVEFLDAAFSQRRVCIKVMDVQFAGDSKPSSWPFR